MSNAGLLLCVIFAAPFIVYFIARLISAAYFLSKEQHERRKHHG